MKKFLIKLGVLSSLLLVLAAQADTTNPLGTTLNTTLQDNVNGTIITNLGTISTGGAVSISSSGNNVSIINSGSLSSDNAAIVTGGTNVNILNSGTLTISQGGNGMYITGANTTITNGTSGQIIINDPGTYGIWILSGSNSTVINYGTISGGAAIVGFSDTLVTNYGSISDGGISGGVVTNYGNITTSANYSWATSGSTVTNYGVITTYGYEGCPICTGGNSVESANHGEIITYGERSFVQISNSTNFLFTNSGSITTHGLNAYGIMIGADLLANSTINSLIVNSGSIVTYGQNAYGVWFQYASSNTLINSGSIIANNPSSKAIYVSSAAHNNTVQLNRGSLIIGDIYADPSTTGSALKINLGAGASYAYSVTGPWTVTDLDNRPMVTGSAYAAGIGAQETASEMLYQRTSAITSSLDRRLRSYASDEVDNQPYWLDVYYSDVSRNSGGNYSTQTAFSNFNYGITAGFKLPSEITPLELIVNVAQSNLNIDSGNQKIDSTSLMTGLLAPDLADVFGAKLSAKAMVGYADHDGDRKVMTNSLLYDGSRQIKSDYNSVYGVVGTALTKLFPITDRLTADVILGLDLNAQRVESYKETDYFAWDSRILTQLQSRVQTGLDYKLWGDKGSIFARVGAEHRDLIGGTTQDYSINGTNVSFNTNNKNDTYLTAQLGMKAQLEKRIQLFGVVNTLHSSDSVNSVSGNIGIRADF